MYAIKILSFSLPVYQLYLYRAGIHVNQYMNLFMHIPPPGFLIILCILIEQNPEKTQSLLLCICKNNDRHLFSHQRKDQMTDKPQKIIKYLMRHA